MSILNAPSRVWFATIALGCLGLVAVGLTLQHLLRLSPCPLCIFQRVLYLLIALVALVGFAVPRGRLFGWSAIAGLGGFGVAVAGYQSWLQAFPELASECSYTDPNILERWVDWLGMQWPGLFLATGFCSSKEWVFMGLSMANWSLLLFVGISLFAVDRFRRP